MSWKGLLVLSLLAMGLAALWQLRREERQEMVDQVFDRALLEDFDADRLVAIGIEHLERRVHVRLEREPYGGS